MDLEQRKLLLAQRLLELNDVRMIASVELLLKEFKAELYEAELKPMTKEELVQRIETAEREVENGRVYTTEDLLKKFNLE